MAARELLKTLLAELHELSQSESVVGRVRVAGSANLLALSSIGIGFGAATGNALGSGGAASGDAGLDGAGAGGGFTVEPRAFVVVGPDGRAEMIALRRGKGAAVRRGIELLADRTARPRDDER